MGQTRPLFVYFVHFKWQIKHNFNCKWSKHILCAWDSNLGQQYGRRRWIHWAYIKIKKASQVIGKCYSTLLLYLFSIKCIRKQPEMVHFWNENEIETFFWHAIQLVFLPPLIPSRGSRVVYCCFVTLWSMSMAPPFLILRWVVRTDHPLKFHHLG